MCVFIGIFIQDLFGLPIILPMKGLYILVFLVCEGKCCLYKITFIQTEPLEGHQKLNNALDLLMIDPKISPSTSTSSSLGKIQLDWGNGKLSSKPYNSFLSFVCQLANCILVATDHLHTSTSPIDSGFIHQGYFR